MSANRALAENLQEVPFLCLVQSHDNSGGKHRVERFNRTGNWEIAPSGSSCAKKSGEVKGNRWRRELEEYGSDNKNKVGIPDAESKEERDGQIYEHWFISSSHLIGCWIYYVWCLLGLEFSNTSLRHVLITGREQRPTVSLGRWRLWHTLLPPQMFFATVIQIELTLNQS